MSFAIQTSSLTKRFGEVVALNNLDLTVESGQVFGYLGPNGAGKTTTIRLLMGLTSPTSGSATINGKHCFEDRDELHRQIGYLPGDFFAYPRMSALQYLTYLGNLRGGITQSEIEGLAERLHLRLDKEVKSLSHGNRQKVGIVQAFMHKPQLLILDEPTSGLDPLMQREFLTMCTEARGDGCTVFLSSHILGEVEDIADNVGIVREGQLVTVESIAAIRESQRRHVDFTFVDTVPAAELNRIPNVGNIQVDGRTATVEVNGSMDELMRVAAPFGIEKLVSHELDLEHAFMHFYESGK